MASINPHRNGLSVTPIAEIVAYWETRQDESGLAVDWAEAHERCWRCAMERSLQRCHIRPRALGGPDEPANLVLLCKACHEEAPDVDDPEFMWLWLRAHAQPIYETYWHMRGLKEYEFLFGKPPPATESAADPALRAAVERYVRRTTNHAYAPQPVKPSTYAWVYRKVFEELGMIGR